MAKQFQTEIVSVDSRQVYREMPIGTAQPSQEQLKAIKHHLIATHSIAEPLTAPQYAAEAEKALEEIYTHHDVAIAVGGSTLYYKALLKGLDEVPPVTPEAKDKVKALFDTSGIEGLQKEVELHDPDYYVQADRQNHRRLMRALEVFYSTGIPLSQYHKKGKPSVKPFTQVKKFGLMLPMQTLYERINTRCDDMLGAGLMDEVKALYPYRHLPPLQTVGYQEFFNVLDGKWQYEYAIEKFKQHTRNYAKRQMTWLRKEEGIEWKD